jgi:hypothetical protein
MTVSRTLPQGGPAFISVFRNASLASGTSQATPTETVELPTTLKSFLDMYPTPKHEPPTKPQHPNAPSQTPGLSQRDILKFEGMPNDSSSLLQTIEPMLPTPTSEQGEKALFINMLDRSLDEIWSDFVGVTGATKVTPDQKDLDLVQELRAMEEKSKIDSARSLSIRAAIKKEKDMLKLAKESES